MKTDKDHSNLIESLKKLIKFRFFYADSQPMEPIANAKYFRPLTGAISKR